jgi:hypothetical protein
VPLRNPVCSVAGDENLAKLPVGALRITVKRRSHPLPNTELEGIEVSLQTLARRAYELGRNDALKKVVAVLNGDRPFAEQLALMGPEGGSTGSDPGSREPAHAGSEHENMNGTGPSMGTSTAPWWAWPVR